MVCVLEIAMSKCTHFVDGINERQSFQSADDSKVLLKLSAMLDTIAHYECKRNALLKELPAPPPSIPILDAVRTLDFVKVHITVQMCFGRRILFLCSRLLTICVLT
jgi:hypothetical protein